jgi:hypothetical protein
MLEKRPSSNEQSITSKRRRPNFVPDPDQFGHQIAGVFGVKDR